MFGFLLFSPQKEIFLTGLCSPGLHYDESGKRCLPCPKGTFQEEHGRTTCAACPVGTTTVAAGTKLHSKCIPFCPIGYYFDEASRVCEPCGLRGYQPERGQDRCIPCPDGTVPIYQNSTSLQHCLDKCKAGQQRSPDGSVCEPCAIGSFKSAEESVCMMCPAGFTTLSKASKSLTSCSIKICFPGTILNINTEKCEPCDYGLYMDEYDGRICKSCPVSTTTYQTGANSAKMCEWTNQCKAATHNCHWLAVCIDLPDENHKKMYSCKCKPGFVGSGFHCVDACQGFCQNGGVCLKTGRGETRCNCAQGFSGQRCQAVVDDDTCKSLLSAVGYKSHLLDPLGKYTFLSGVMLKLLLIFLVLAVLVQPRPVSNEKAVSRRIDLPELHLKLTSTATSGTI
ncbi:unnamed protein product [Caenorhabditis auriculariae]|uniref:EGF-like domain-containing protein n=1 Tax=Caenorhabditis auriculariae TaxID=2777116 RepID=A0A8S1HEJ1_9PELO|nr:unnamed protein product [Caenorhabditis auriculariae]